MKDYCSDPYENLCWLDLETTGLHNDLDAILEIGIVITSKDLDVIAERSWVVNTSSQPGLKVRDIDPFVWKMHTKNGLWLKSLDSKIALDVAVELAKEFIGKHDAMGSPLCGSTISFDRAFLKAQAPELLQSLHYRNIDVSTLKNMFAIHFPNIPAFDKRPSDHRVIGDLKNSIAEYWHYLQWMQSGKLELG